MELLPVAALAGLACVTWLALRLLNASLGADVDVFARLVGGYRGEGWPIGVQEEDLDRPWGRALPPEDDHVVGVESLRPTLRTRL